MEAVEPVRTATTAALMQCSTCGTRAHHPLDYVISKNARGEAVCRACYWNRWTRDSHLLSAAEPATVEDARAHADKNGYEYLGAVGASAHHVRCRACGKLSAQRLGDIAWGCACSRNTKSASETRVNSTKSRTPTVRFKDSGATAVAWWDHSRNSQADFDSASQAATRRVGWVCPACGHRFTASVREMADRPACPRCAKARKAAWDVEYARLKTTMVAEHPVLAAAWDDPEDPATVPIAGGWQLYRFRCPNGHHPKISPHTYMQSGCPHCLAAQTRKSQLERSLAKLWPEIAAQWVSAKEGKLTPETVTDTSKHVVLWRDAHCGYEWEESVRDRNKYQRFRCPQCRTILDSLAYQYPLLAREWSPNNPTTAWHVRPHGTTLFEPEWVCPNNDAHVWPATLTSRTNGSDCPECREIGKSVVELNHFAAAKTAFGSARSGVKLRSDRFTRRPAWTADITVELPGGQTLVIEYDGSYWHRDKADIDRAKSLDLLAAGHRLVRLREDPLAPLDIDDSSYVEFIVYSTAPDPAGVMERIREHWLA
ncbi:zinc-ribbon domain-containing protein [Mycolicibacterium sp.]|uniref:zinc-ribbon domain-containing protein n=1 Tax=Mycolicibacterium sp. TaxID=2320850 RepID=UPI00356115DA